MIPVQHSRIPPRNTSAVTALLLSLLLLCPGAFSENEADIGLYDYGGANPQALEAYRQGWVEILEYGRWSEAERLYRRAVSIDPGFLIAKSVLARISTDLKERMRLQREVESARSRVDANGQLILDVYMKTLDLINARELGQTLPAGFRGALAEQAVGDYAKFISRYPAEWAVRIEHIEWVHALHGPQRALEVMQTREQAAEDLDVPQMALSYSYFPAYFYAELGNHEKAQTLAETFAARLPEEGLPQPHYLAAYLAYESGNLELAAREIELALRLDPRHLIAQRLAKQIETARDLSKEGAFPKQSGTD